MIREYYEYIWVIKFNNLDDTEKFIERYKLLQQRQEETKNMNSSKYMTLNLIHYKILPQRQFHKRWIS